MADSVLTRDGPVAVPLDYQVPASGELIPLSVRATIDGTSAATSFYAVVQVIAPSGRVMFSAITAAIAAGGSADCSWFPWWRGIAAGVTPSPNPLGTLYAWYDFSDASTLTIDGSSKISAIRDKTGNGHDLGQSLSTARPAQSVLNGLGAGLFNSASYTALTLIPVADPLPQPFTIAVVFTQTASGPVTYLPGPYGGSGTVGTNPVFFVTNTSSAFAIEQGVGSIVTALGAPFTQQQITGVFHGASSSLRLNGVATAGTVDNDPLSTISVGAQQYPKRPGLVEALDGQVGEVLIYNSHLTAAQLSSVETYLKAKWATP